MLNQRCLFSTNNGGELAEVEFSVAGQHRQQQRIRLFLDPAEHGLGPLSRRGTANLSGLCRRPDRCVVNDAEPCAAFTQLCLQLLKHGLSGEGEEARIRL